MVNIPSMPSIPSGAPGMPVFQNISGFGRVGIQIIGADKLDRAIQDLLRANRDVNRVLRLIGQKMKTMIRANFEREENSDGSAWAPLSEYTKAQRAEGDSTRNLEPEMLRDTGRLYNSIAWKVGRDNSVFSGTNVDYAPDLQQGDKSKNLPAREFVYINDSGLDELTRFLTNELIVNALTRGF